MMFFENVTKGEENTGVLWRVREGKGNDRMGE